MTSSINEPIAVVGLGYVGLPLALAFGRHFKTIGFDISKAKLEAYRDGFDPTGEMDPASFLEAKRLRFSSDPASLAEARVIIVAVPTPVDEAHHPDLELLRRACEMVGRVMMRGVVVVFESTVYPGTTEEECVPILEASSGYKWKEEFFVGYSPERVNPGDKVHTLETITKVVAGDTTETLGRLSSLYETIIEAGVHRAPTIKVAEAAKVIENTQRDLNIALMNEFAMIFNHLGVDTQAVLDAASTKWNFLRFTPGLVGGHCIGVDPYYLTYKAQTKGYYPDVILAGRRLNEGMGRFIAEQTVRKLIEAGIAVKGAKIGIFGLAFKENCADLRNTRVIDVVRVLETYGAEILIHDPWVDPVEAQHEYGIDLVGLEQMESLDCAVLAVAHGEFRALGSQRMLSMLNRPGVVIDVKAVLEPKELAVDKVAFWRL